MNQNITRNALMRLNKLIRIKPTEGYHIKRVYHACVSYRKENGRNLPTTHVNKPFRPQYRQYCRQEESSTSPASSNQRELCFVTKLIGIETMPEHKDGDRVLLPKSMYSHGVY
jgi:hypothetical protein